MYLLLNGILRIVSKICLDWALTSSWSGRSSRRAKCTRSFAIAIKIEIAVPVLVRAVPTHVRAVPVLVRTVQIHVRAVSTNVRTVPTHVRAVPTHVRAVPTHVKAVSTHVGIVVPLGFTQITSDLRGQHSRCKRVILGHY